MSESPVLLITGASSGIGAATARAAVEHGYHLALGARSVDKLERLQHELGQDRVWVHGCDVTSASSVADFVDRAVAQWGRLDVAFANAGVGGEKGGFSGAPIESWERIVQTNILGLAITIQKTLPELKKSRGHVILTGSVAGRRTLAGSMYGVSKWAANALGYNLREELRGTGVRVTVIEPGIVDTPFFDDPKPDGLRPEDVARTVLFAVTSPPTVEVHELQVLPTPRVE